MNRTLAPADIAHYYPQPAKLSMPPASHGRVAAEPKRRDRRPNAAPAYYLGRPAAVWIAAMRPRHRRAASPYLMEAPVSGDSPTRGSGVLQHS